MEKKVSLETIPTFHQFSKKKPTFSAVCLVTILLSYLMCSTTIKTRGKGKDLSTTLTNITTKIDCLGGFALVMFNPYHTTSSTRPIDYLVSPRTRIWTKAFEKAFLTIHYAGHNLVIRQYTTLAMKQPQYFPHR